MTLPPEGVAVLGLGAVTVAASVSDWPEVTADGDAPRADGRRVGRDRQVGGGAGGGVAAAGEAGR